MRKKHPIGNASHNFCIGKTVEEMEVPTQDILYTLDKENWIPNEFDIANDANQRITIEADNINDTDVWLMKLITQQQ